MPVFRSAYGDKSPVRVVFPAQGKTKQSFKDECDINKIMSKYQRTGIIDFVNRNVGRYGDGQAPDFQQCLDVVVAGQALFDELPSSIRKRFGNDPAEFLAFVEDPANDAAAIQMGLKAAPVVADVGEPVPTLVVEPPKPV